MEDFAGFAVIFALVGAVAFGGTLAAKPWSWDSAVVEACQKRGYWQTGQTRVNCTIDTPVNSR